MHNGKDIGVLTAGMGNDILTQLNMDKPVVIQ
jgi:hypothetical protein